MTRIGVLGLGRMGGAIFDRLVSAGHEVVGFDPRGSRGASSAAELASSVEVLLTVLPGRAELADAAPGVLTHLRPGGLWLDLTSGDPRLSESLAASAPEVDAVGAPMGGGPADAVAGTLTFYVGGAPAAVDRALPLFEVLGRVERAGDGVGDGHTVKLLANLLWFGQAVAVTEAMLLGTSLGVSAQVLGDILGRSAGGSAFLEGYAERLIAGDVVPNFGIDRVVEELDTLAAAAASTGTPFELSALVARLHRETLERFGAVDGELLVARLIEQRAGRTLS